MTAFAVGLSLLFFGMNQLSAAEVFVPRAGRSASSTVDITDVVSSTVCCLCSPVAAAA
ncbi:MAG: hypothetical protein R2856_29620 [Caldilineaceae bacterium]